MTGGAGFIGSHTVDALIAAGARVAIVDDLSTGLRENIHPRARFYRMATASPRLSTVFRRERPQYVFALAAVSNPPVSIQDPLRDAAGLVGLINILELSVRHRVRKILYSSSGFIYGNARRLPTPETEPFQSLAPYNISKFASEQYLELYASHHKLPIAILRYSTVYGPRQLSRVIADYIGKISAGRRAEIYGTKTRDYIYVSDVAAANLRAMEIKNYRGESVFNIGSGREINLIALYRMIAKLLGKPDNKPIRKPSKPGEVDRFCLDIRRARRILGFRPTVKLNDGLRKTVQWFLESRRR